MYGEFEIIDKIASMFQTPEGLTLGIGDDCAILDPGRFDLVTTDTIVEDIHFRRAWCSPEDIGWKALSVCLSDVAAMGGGPGAFFLNLSLPPDCDEPLVDGLLAGIKKACVDLIPESFEVAVGGGDITRSPGPLVISVTLLGEASPAGPITRGGALPGDRIALLGPVGSASCALQVYENHEERAADFPNLTSAYRRPQPRVREGALLGLYGVPSALIDVSDGLLQDLNHILVASGVGAKLETHNLPNDPELTAACEQLFGGQEAFLNFALSGGEDYELLIVVPPARMTKLWDLARRYDWDVFDIGEIRSPEEGLVVIGPHGQEFEHNLAGYRHF